VCVCARARPYTYIENIHIILYKIIHIYTKHVRDLPATFSVAIV